MTFPRGNAARSGFAGNAIARARLAVTSGSMPLMIAAHDYRTCLPHMVAAHGYRPCLVCSGRVPRLTVLVGDSRG